MHVLEVINPVAQQRGMITTKSINPRPSSLDDKTVGLLWSGTHGGDVALKRAGEMLQESFRNVKTRFYVSGGYPVLPTF
jgi:hypothetical protein